VGELIERDDEPLGSSRPGAVDELAMRSGPSSKPEEDGGGSHDVLVALLANDSAPWRPGGRCGAGDGDLTIGLTACTAGGEMITGNEYCGEDGRRLVTRTGKAGPGKPGGDAGHKASSPNGTLSCSVVPRSAPASRA